MSDLMTTADMADGKLDLTTLKVYINGDENTVNKPRLLPNVDVGSLAKLNKSVNDRVNLQIATIPAGRKGYATLAAAQAAQASLAVNTIVEVTNDTTTTNNGVYLWNGTTLTKSAYDPKSTAVAEAATYTDSQLAPFNTQFRFVAPTNYSFVYIDKNGMSSVALTKNGQLQVADLKAVKINNTDADVFIKSTQLTQPSGTKTYLKDNFSAYAPKNFKLAVLDGSAKVAVGIKTDGTFAAQKIETTSINGTSVTALINAAFSGGGTSTAKSLPNLDSDIAVIFSYGQSLSIGADGTPPVTTTQKYDNVMLNTGILSSTTVPTSLVPAIEQTQETPASGVGDMVQALIQTENSIDYTKHNYQLGLSATGQGGAPISGLIKSAGNPYNYNIQRLTDFKNLANAQNKIAKCLAVFWTQGESDYINKTLAADYKTMFTQLVSDLNTDLKAVTKQSEPVKVISYQTQSHAMYGYAGNPYIAVAQWEMSKTVANYHIACPLYWSPYPQHQNNIYYKILGAYYGIAYKRIIVDKLDWKPLEPTQLMVQGNVALIKFNVPVGELVFDTSTRAQQANMGFSMVNASGIAYTINSVEIVNQNTVRITAAQAITSNSEVRYGYINGGNLRDKQGDTLIFDPSNINYKMHNWCVIFKLLTA